MTAVPPSGPFDTPPSTVGVDVHAMLTSAVRGLPVGDYDTAMVENARTWPPDIVLWFASMLRRAGEAGLAAGRLERLDEHPVIERLTARVADLEAEVKRRRR